MTKSDGPAAPADANSDGGMTAARKLVRCVKRFSVQCWGLFAGNVSSECVGRPAASTTVDSLTAHPHDLDPPANLRQVEVDTGREKGELKAVKW